MLCALCSIITIAKFRNHVPLIFNAYGGFPDCCVCHTPAGLLFLMAFPKPRLRVLIGILFNVITAATFPQFNTISSNQPLSNASSLDSFPAGPLPQSDGVASNQLSPNASTQYVSSAHSLALLAVYQSSSTDMIRKRVHRNIERYQFDVPNTSLRVIIDIPYNIQLAPASILASLNDLARLSSLAPLRATVDTVRATSSQQVDLVLIPKPMMNHDRKLTNEETISILSLYRAKVDRMHVFLAQRFTVFRNRVIIAWGYILNNPSRPLTGIQ